MSGLFNAISEALAPASPTQPQTTTGANKPPVDSIHPVVPPTAQTSEFINAGNTSSQPDYAPGPGFGGGFGGGLASNPNVPRPGTSINPETGKPHTAGLTRAELQAKKEAEANANTVPSELSGREQAAAQLANATASTGVRPTAAHLTSYTAVMPTGTSLPATVTAPAPSYNSSLNPNANVATPGAMTPGLEMPGAWGPVPVAPVPGSSPNAPSSVYEDVTTGLEKVGLAAYNIIPQSLKEVISPNVNTSAPTSPARSTQPSTLTSSTSTSARGPSLLDQAKAQTNTLFTQAQQTVEQARHSNVAAQGEGLIKDVRGFLGDVIAHTPFVGEPITATPKTTAGTKTSLPSQEPLGAKPGEKTAGVGALPGKLSEQGVAVLPDEKKQPVRENQSSLPGEVSAFGSGATASSSAGPSGSSRAVDASTTSGSNAVEALSPPPSGSTVPEPAPHHDETPSSAGILGESGDRNVNAVAPRESAPSASTVPEPDYSRGLEPASTPSVDLLSMPATALALGTLPEPTSSRNVEATTIPQTTSEPSQSRFVESLPEANTNSSVDNTNNTAPSTTLSSSETAPSSFANDPIYEPLSTSNTSTFEPLSVGNASTTGTSAYDNHSTATTGTSAYDNNSTAEPFSSRSEFISEPTTQSSTHRSYGGLAAPLPSTFLGTGAAHGATDLDTVKGISSDSAYPGNANGTGLNPSSDLSTTSTSGLSPSPPSNERTTSLASVTAIRDGHEGERKSSSLAKQALGASALATVAEGQKSTTRGTGPEHTTSLAPGNVEDGVGHPSTRNTDTVEPGRAPTTTSTSTTPQIGVAPTQNTNAVEPTKPALRDEQQPTTNTTQSTGPHAPYPMEGHDQPKSKVFGTGKDTTGHEILKHDGVAVPDAAPTGTTTGTSPISPISSGHHGAKEEVGGHHRTASGSSLGADGKKKSGFLGKLKEKLHHHKE